MKTLSQRLTCNSCGEEYNLNINSSHNGFRAIISVKCNECGSFQGDV